MTVTGVRFQEREGAQDLSLDPQINRFGNIFACQGKGGSGNGERYFAVNAASLLANGPFVQQINMPSLSSFVAIRQAGIAQVNASASGLVAKSLKVDDPDSDALYGLGDTITIDFPSEGLGEAQAQVIGIEEAEGATERTLHLDDLPLSHPDTQRASIKDMMDQIVAGGARAIVTSPNGLLAFDLAAQQAGVIKDVNGVVRARGGAQPDGKFGWRFYDAAGGLIQFLTGIPAAGQSTAAMDWSA